MRWSLATVLEIVVLASATLFSASDAACRRRWCKYSVKLCLDESSALTRWSSPSPQGCVLKTSSSPDDLLLQWNQQTGACSLFHYQQVCRLMQTSDASGSALCSVYRAAALASCAASLNARLLGVWLAGGSSRFSNLVCQSEPTNYRLIGVNLQWTEEGARFDGFSSYALLNDSRFVGSDTSGGFTWLMRLKREPQVQPFMEAVSCSNFQAVGRHFWEYGVANKMCYNRYGLATDPTNFLLNSAANMLPADNNRWINIGIAAGSSAASSFFFYGSGFVSTVVDTPVTGSASACYYLSIGHRLSSSSYYLMGVVQAIAIANYTMTEQENS